MPLLRCCKLIRVILGSLVLPFWASAQQERPDYSTLFDKTDVMIPARDGVKLHTEIYSPKNAAEPLPIIFERTPYGLSDDEKGYSRKLGRYAEMIPDGYIFVFQDIRGRYGSEGLLGISYGGWLTVMGMLEPHPALKAVSEQASPADMFLGDDFHHNGAFRLSYGYEYSTMMETDKTNFSFQFDRFDTYEWYLQLGALSNANKKYIHGALPTWNDFVAHPNYDSFWKQQAMPFVLRRPKVPNLNVAGWWDQEDFYGPMKIYEILEKEDPDHLNYLVAGPWNHGGWAHGAGNSLGLIPFGSDTALYFRQKIEAPWFAYWLKNQGSLPLKEALLFQTGSDTWVKFDSWPPREAKTQNLYFHPDSKLSLDAPTEESAEAFDNYTSDPAHPVPYRHRPVDMTYPEDHPGSWYTWLVEDQRFVDNRPDVLTWQTDVLKEDVTLAGQVTAKLFASSTGSDADWIVKLIDVYPEKYPEKWQLSGRPAWSRLSRSICTPRTMCSRTATASWFRCKAPGFPSSTATRKNSSRTFLQPRNRTTRKPPSAFIARNASLRAWKFPYSLPPREQIEVAPGARAAGTKVSSLGLHGVKNRRASGQFPGRHRQPADFDRRLAVLEESLWGSRRVFHGREDQGTASEKNAPLTTESDCDIS